MEWKGNVITCCHPVTHVGVCLAEQSLTLNSFPAQEPAILPGARDLHKKARTSCTNCGQASETESRCWTAEGRGAASRRVLEQEKGRKRAGMFTPDAPALLPAGGRKSPGLRGPGSSQSPLGNSVAVSELNTQFTSFSTEKPSAWCSVWLIGAVWLHGSRGYVVARSRIFGQQWQC